MMRKDEAAKLFVKKKQTVDKLEKEIYLNNLFAFNRDVLRIEEGKDKAGGKRVRLRNFHKNLCDFVERGKDKKKLILVPRGHLKSSLITVGYTLQKIAKNPSERILIANATASMAEAFLRQIKSHLKYNERFIELFDDFSEDAEKWTDSMIRFNTGEETFRAKEANITAYGIGGNLVSQHYDTIIFDDPHNRDNITTKDQIDKVKLAFKDALDLLEPGGEFVVIGTRWHYDDLYGWLMDEDEPVSRNFEAFERMAVEGATIKRQENGGYEIVDGRVLWPEKYSMDHLESLLDDKGLYEWSCQYQNRPIDDENAIFKRGWFKEYDKSEIENRNLKIFTAIDPAISLKERADYTAIITIGVDVFKNIYILEIKRDRYTEKEIADELFYTYEQYKPIDIVIETVAFQKTLQNFIQDEFQRRGHSLPIREVRPDSNEPKEKRIRSLQPYYMRGNILHNSSVKNIDYLEDELLRFPKGKHDDTVDALAYAVDTSYPPRKKPRGSSNKGYLY